MIVLPNWIRSVIFVAFVYAFVQKGFCFRNYFDMPLKLITLLLFLYTVTQMHLTLNNASKPKGEWR